MDNQAPASVECYEIARQLKTSGTATTTDGWTVSYGGDRNIPHSQSIIATKSDQTTKLDHYWGSEGIAHLLLKARSQ